MRFDIVTLFAELFQPFLTNGVTRRAFETNQIEIQFSNPRDFAEGNYKRVDDRPFGGGPGMVMLAEPLSQCVTHIHEQRGTDVPVILFSPVGEPLSHAIVQQWAQSTGAIMVCGRYEGLDQRFIDKHVTHQVSLGDFVLSGGEIAAIAMLDAIARLQPGVLNTENSHHQDSFNPTLNGLLDCPHYTRPLNWLDQVVPSVLTSGHHQNIERWRREKSLDITARLRPDLILQARRAGGLSHLDECYLNRDHSA
jgi:tRNA (guanine37-N1)-methyltransferase